MRSGETWLPVVGYEGFYEVSDLGRVKSLSRRVVSPVGSKVIRERFLKTAHKGVKYCGATLFKFGKSESRSVHTMVLRAFVGEPGAGQEGCHWNGDCHDNQLSNLRWDTRAANRADSFRHGAIPLGSKRASAKLDEGKVLRIRARVQNGEGYESVAIDFGVNARTIGKVVRREQWKHVA